MSIETAEKLKKLTPEPFENLATAVLRFTNPLYSRLVHPGLNTDGRTVKSNLDGILLVPGSNPPHFVIFHHTVVAKRHLKAKWLHERTASGRGSRTEDGDVIKALLWSERQRTDHDPHTQVTVVLTYNKIPAEDLVAEVGQTCARHSISLEILEFSALLHFLDNVPDGQWLRYKLLGIAQERLSIGLLREISLQSWQEYRRHEFLGDESAWVDRALDERLHGEVWSGARRVTFLIADSGKGKSTTSCRLMKKHLDADGLGLWIQPHELEATTTVAGVVEKALRCRYPTLETGSGQRALELAARQGGLLLIGDDINRSLRPEGLLQRVAAWNGPTSSDQGKHGTDLGYRILCPVWPKVLDPLLDRSRQTIEPLCVQGGDFLPTEATSAVERRAALEGRHLTTLQAEDLADALGHDPLLINLWGEKQETIVRVTGMPVAFSVLDRFVRSHLRNLQASPGSDLLPEEAWECLLDLARKMLRAPRMAPGWRDLQAWFENAPRRLEVLRAVLSDRKICRLSEGPPPVQLQFRHDRIRDHLLACALIDLLHSDSLPEPLFAEPFFAELVGWALAAGDLEPRQVHQLATANPLALACALRFFREPETPAQSAIVDSLRTWLSTHAADGRRSASIRGAIQLELARTDSSLVLDLAACFPDPVSGPLLEARLRNGDVEAGAQLCAVVGLGRHVARVVSLIRHAADRRGRPFRDHVIELLVRPNGRAHLLGGALNLAGWLADPRLSAAIAVAWEQASAESGRLASFIWAAARCSETKPAPALGAMLLAWSGLSDQAPKPHHRSDRISVASTLRDAFAEHPPIDAVVRLLVERAKDHALRWPLIVTLKHMNHPDAVAFIARAAALADHEAEDRGKRAYSRLSWGTTDHWDGWFGDHSLKPDCLTRLRHLWDSSDNDSHLRRHAFSLWLTGAGRRELPILQGFDSSSPFYNEALTKRIELGDPSAADGVVGMLSVAQDPDSWWNQCERIWCERLKAALDSYLGALEATLATTWDFNGVNPDSAELLRAIPTVDGQELLLKHWPHLKRSYSFVQAALCIATPETLDAVAEVMKECPEPGRLLQHLEYALGLNDPGRQGRVSLRQLAAVEPYMDQLSDNTLRELWSFCNERQLWIWRRNHLDARLSEELRRELGLDADALWAQLDQFSGSKKNSWYPIESWADGFQSRGDPAGRAQQVLAEWLANRGTKQAVEVMRRFLLVRGRRNDVALLVPSSGRAIADSTTRELIDDTRFAVSRRTLE